MDVFLPCLLSLLPITIVAFAPWRIWVELEHRKEVTAKPGSIWLHFLGAAVMALGLACLMVALERSDQLDYGDDGHAGEWGIGGLSLVVSGIWFMVRANAPTSESEPK